jgi:hypothetical protein
MAVASAIELPPHDRAKSNSPGAKWTSREQAGARENETEFFVTAGFRYDFYADDQKRCAFVPMCR